MSDTDEMKTWAVETTTHYVVRAPNKDFAAAIVESLCAEDPPTTIDIQEITKQSEIPADWNSRCIPYGGEQLPLSQILEEDG